MHINGKLFINNEWIDSKSTEVVRNPFTGELIGELHQATEEDVTKAIQCAKEAQMSFKMVGHYEKANMLRRIARRIQDNKDQMASLMSMEMGKPLRDAIAEVNTTIRSFEWFATQIEIENDEIVPSHTNAIQIVIKEPIGVVALITPWNFPLNLIARKLAPALAAGNAIIIKPSAKSGLVATKLIEMIEPEIKLPGLVNLIHGSAIMFSRVIMESDDVKKISFTGSTAVGKILANAASSTLKKVSLELGGNAPFIVTENADIVKAAKAIVTTKMRNNGQICVSPNRVLVSRKIEERFINEISKAMDQVVFGNPTNLETEYSVVVDDGAASKIQELLADAYEKGAECVRVHEADFKKDNFVPLTVIRNVDSSMRIYREEIFGPVISIVPFDTLEEVIPIANDTEYGLASYLFSEDSSEIKWIVSNIETGMVGVNHTAVSTSETPFGGIKQSGYGIENGRYGLREYQNVKLITIEEPASPFKE